MSAVSRACIVIRYTVKRGEPGLYDVVTFRVGLEDVTSMSMTSRQNMAIQPARH